MRLPMRTIAILALLLLPAAPAAAQSASASSSSTVNPNDPRDIARRAPLLPLAEASAIALKRVPGTVLGAMVETNDGIRTWQIDIQRDGGRRVRMWLNAGTGEFLKMVDR
jgi:uncharacterized membrane protein YkoI